MIPPHPGLIAGVGERRQDDEGTGAAGTPLNQVGGDLSACVRRREGDTVGLLENCPAQFQRGGLSLRTVCRQ
jgi:hypothetical protein